MLLLSEIANIKIPSDLDNQEIYKIYIKSDRESDEYNVLQCYILNYQNKR